MCNTPHFWHFNAKMKEVMFNRKIIEELKAPFTVSSRLSMDKKIGEGIFDFLFCFIKPYQML